MRVAQVFFWVCQNPWPAVSLFKRYDGRAFKLLAAFTCRMTRYTDTERCYLDKVRRREVFVGFQEYRKALKQLRTTRVGNFQGLQCPILFNHWKT